MDVLQGGVVSTSPNPEAGGPSLVGCPRLFIQFIRSYPPYRRPFLYPQPEDAPCRGDRDPLHMGSSLNFETFSTQWWHIMMTSVALSHVRVRTYLPLPIFTLTALSYPISTALFTYRLRQTQLIINKASFTYVHTCIIWLMRINRDFKQFFRHKFFRVGGRSAVTSE